MLKNGKAILFLLAAFLPLILQAQPTLTLADMRPPGGTTFYYYDSHYVNSQMPQPGNAGANQLWDFSAYPTTGINQFTYDSCGNGSCITTTDIGGYHRQYDITGNALALRLAGCDMYRSYINPDDLFRFPMTFNTKYVDTFTVDGIINFPQFTMLKMDGTDSVEADGWGTLITPANTYTNTLRVKRVQTFRDVTNPPNAYGNRVVISYTWYNSSRSDFLAKIVTEWAAGSSICEGFRFAYARNALGTGSQLRQETYWTISPNPAKETAHLHLNLSGAGKANILILDMAGRVLQSIPEMPLTAGGHDIPCDISALSPGIYTVRLTAGNSVSTKKLVVQ